MKPVILYQRPPATATAGVVWVAAKDPSGTCHAVIFGYLYYLDHASKRDAPIKLDYTICSSLPGLATEWSEGPMNCLECLAEMERYR